ncbi:MAG: hypothetical protein ABIZ80_02000 [Bryobacteraceae bacterium]
MNRIFTDILDGIGGSFRHLANGNYEVLAMIVVVIAVAGFLFLRK